MKSFLVSITFLALFFTFLFFLSTSTPSNNGVEIAPDTKVENLIETQKQAESIQKSIVLPAKKQTPRIQDSFKTYAKEAFEKLPSESDARAEVENNPHDTPGSVMKAGSVLGYVADQMKDDKRNVDTGLKFFKACAQSPNVVSTIRAVCLRNLVDFSSRYRNNVRVSFADYPEDIQRIARHIPRLR